MLIRRLLHLRHGLQTLTTTTVAASSSSTLFAPLPFRGLPNGLFSPRLLSSSGRDDDPRQPWAFTSESSDPDPFADLHSAAADDAGQAPVGSGAVAEDSWSEVFHKEDGEKGDVFEDIYKGAAAEAPAEGTPEEQWETLDLEEKDDLIAAAMHDEEIKEIEDEVVGIGDEVGGIDELNAERDDDVERQRQENKAREQQLLEIIKGPNRAFGDLISASGITDDMIDSLILLKDVRGIKGMPSLSQIQDGALEKMSEPSSRHDAERQMQEEIAKARVRQVDEKGRAYGTGKRKCSIARVWIQPGDGKFIVNDKQFDAYFPILDHRADLLRPFTVTKTLGLWDVNCTVKGGGVSGQVGAVRLGISRALQNFEPGFRPYLKADGYLTRDSRIVERKKPGKAKARKSFQWVKR